MDQSDNAVKKMVIVGFGSVGRIFWTAGSSVGQWGADECLVVDPGEEAAAKAESWGMKVLRVALSASNFEDELAPRLAPGSVVVNLAVDVDSLALARLARSCGAMYLDAGIDLWPERHGSGREPTVAQERSELLAALPKGIGHPTALIGHGANPGLASHWAKEGVWELAVELGLASVRPTSRDEWAKLAERLGLRVVQIAERDHGSFVPRKGVFCNTWSVQGLAREALQDAELGWGSHEGKAPFGSRSEESLGVSSVALPAPGHSAMVRSWTPLGGPADAFMVTHLESIGISGYFSRESTSYAPTCYYAYQPCEPAREALASLASGKWSFGGPEWIPEGSQVEGMDELGALLMGERFGSLWVGSRMTSGIAREIVPGATATSLQVAAGLLAGLEWMRSNPKEGVVEPEDLPSREILAAARPWIGPDFSVRSRWIEPLGIPVDSAHPSDLSFSCFWLGRT